MILPLFSEVINKDVKIPHWDEHPFRESELKVRTSGLTSACLVTHLPVLCTVLCTFHVCVCVQMKIEIVPVKDIRNMSVTWPIPDLHPYYKSSVRN